MPQEVYQHTFTNGLTLLAERMERYRGESGAWDLGAIVQGALTDDTLAAIVTAAGLQAADGGPVGADLSGQVGAISMSEVLTLLGQQGQTGTLRALTEGVSRRAAIQSATSASTCACSRRSPLTQSSSTPESDARTPRARRSRPASGW